MKRIVLGLVLFSFVCGISNGALAMPGSPPQLCAERCVSVPPLSDGPHELWNKTYGGFLLGGWVLPSDLEKSILVIKTDESGDQVWEKTFYAGHSKEPYVNTLGLDEFTTGDILVAGEKIVSNDKDAWVLQLDRNGTMRWALILGGLIDDYSCAVQQINDTCYAVVGSTLSYGAGRVRPVIVHHHTGDRVVASAPAD